MPRVMEVIESDECRGKGIEGDPFRRVKMYHTLDGDLLAENDPMKIEFQITAHYNNPGCESKEPT